MIKKVQALRGLAIIAVVIIHTNADGYAGVFIRPFVNYAVALFIFLSGYLTKIDMVDIKRFYQKRILKVIIPYCIWAIIYTAARGNYDEFVMHFFTARWSAPAYYIFVYIQLVLLTPLVGKLIRSNYRWIGWVVTPVSIVIIRYVMPLLNIPIEFPFSAITFAVWFVYYYLGMMLGNRIITYNVTTKRTILLLLLALLLSEIEGTAWYLVGNYSLATTQLRLTSAFSSIMTILLAYIYINKSSSKISSKMERLLVVLGDCSFGIYFSHILVMNVISIIVPQYLLPFPVKSIVTIMASLVCVLVGKKLLGKYSVYLGL